MNSALSFNEIDEGINSKSQLLDLSGLHFHQILAPRFKQIEQMHASRVVFNPDEVRIIRARIDSIPTIDSDFINSFSFRFLLNTFMENLAASPAEGEILITQKRIELESEKAQLDLRSQLVKTAGLFMVNRFNTIGGVGSVVKPGQFFITKNEINLNKLTDMKIENNEIPAAYQDLLSFYHI